MILVITKISKIFDEVDSEQAIKKKIREIVSREDHANLMDNFIKQGKILWKKTHWKEDDINYVYESFIIYDSIETHKECFDNPVTQEIIKKLIKAGFEISTEIKHINRFLEKQIKI